MPKPGERKKPKPVPGPIARNLRAKIEGCGLNYTKLADFAGVTQPQITKFMQGFDINLATAEKLLETLDEVYVGLYPLRPRSPRSLVSSTSRCVPS